MKTNELKTEAEYQEALKEFYILWETYPNNTLPDAPEAKRFSELADLIEAYEEKHFPIPPNE